MRDAKKQQTYNKFYWRKHKKRLTRLHLQWLRVNTQRVKEQTRRYRKSNKNKCMNAYGGGKCVCCGESTIEFLSLDHIKDDDYKDERGRTGSTTFYARLVVTNFPRGLQTLCHNCQMGKRIGGGFCPHHPNVDLRIERGK